MKKIFLALFLAFLCIDVFSQKSFLDIGAGAGSQTGSVNIGANKNWFVGKSNRLILGTGLRFTSFFGSEADFVSAPANLATVNTSIDTLFAPKPAIYSLNALVNLGYKVSSKLEVGFNIDAIGFSFGPTGSPSFITNSKSKITPASPTALNVLLVGNNDKGSLNSHFYSKYQFRERLGVKVAYQFLFNELTTATKVQTIPEANDRFRLKSSMIYIGLTLGLK